MKTPELPEVSTAVGAPRCSGQVRYRIAGFRSRFGLATGLVLGFALLAGAAGASRYGGALRSGGMARPETAPGSAAARLQADAAQLALNRETLYRLDDRQLAELRARKERFDQLSEATRDQLRKLHCDLAQHPDREQLVAVMTRFLAWTKRLDERVRADLLDKPVDERFQEVCRLRSEESGQAGVLSPADARKFEVWFRGIAEAKADQIQSSLNQLRSSSRSPRVQPLESASHEAKLRFLVIASERLAREIISDSDLQTLKDSLSPLGSKLVSNLNRSRVVRSLVVHPASDSELRKYFLEGLSEDQRADLERLPEEEMKRQLRRLFMQSRQGLPGSGTAGPGR